MGNRVKGKVKKKSIKAAYSSSMSSKRKLSRMGKKQKKDNAGLRATFLGRSKVLRKLQISLKDFRRLCILKGVYPREPRNNRAPGKKKGQVYYHIADVQALAHEPLLNEFREFRSFMKKVRKAAGRDEKDDAQRMMRKDAPQYTLHHLVRERYPRFGDALSDLDDALTMVYLFAALPSQGRLKGQMTFKAKRLAAAWGAYCAHVGAITKLFISVKGVYMEVSLPQYTATPVRWLLPHKFTQYLPKDVDYRVMATFFEFYETLIDFVLYKLYQDIGMRYPLPIVDEKDVGSDAAKLCLFSKEAKFRGVSSTIAAAIDAVQEAPSNSSTTIKDKKSKAKGDSSKLSESVNAVLESIQNGESDDNGDSEDEEEEMDEDEESELGEGASSEIREALKDRTDFEKEQEALVDNEAVIRQQLFSGLTFFLSREVPRGYLELAILSYGGKVGWEGDGSPINMKDGSITHHIVDRPKLLASYDTLPKTREFIQPQWILDCTNNLFILPCSKYGVGKPLPPHLSPWVNNEEEGYKPAYAEEIERLKNGETVSATDDETDEEESESAMEAAAVAKGGSDDVESDDNDQEEEDDSNDEESGDNNDNKDEDEVESDEENEEEKKIQEVDDAKKMAIGMMSKKAKYLYGRMQYGIAKKQANVDLLMKKRKDIEQTKEKNKDGKTLKKLKLERLKDERKKLEDEYSPENTGGSMRKNKQKRKKLNV